MKKINPNEIIILDCGDEQFEIKMKDLLKTLNEYGYTISILYDYAKRIN